jgi:hypothetical protein
MIMVHEDIINDHFLKVKIRRASRFTMFLAKLFGKRITGWDLGTQDYSTVCVSYFWLGKHYIGELKQFTSKTIKVIK